MVTINCALIIVSCVCVYNCQSVRAKSFDKPNEKTRKMPNL
jgi:hypothetical protein